MLAYKTRVRAGEVRRSKFAVQHSKPTRISRWKPAVVSNAGQLLKHVSKLLIDADLHVYRFCVVTDRTEALFVQYDEDRQLRTRLEVDIRLFTAEDVSPQQIRMRVLNKRLSRLAEANGYDFAPITECGLIHSLTVSFTKPL